MVMNISCKFDKSTYNTLASRGLTRKSLHTAAAAYSCVIHSIHRMLSGGYHKNCTLQSIDIHIEVATKKKGCF